MKMLSSAQTLILLVYSCLFIAKSSSSSSSSSSYCPTSSCGEIRNISHPYRLNTDPAYCGYREGELACENNVTFLYLHSHKFYVKAINYSSAYPVIRLVDASINNNHICSFPTVSTYSSNFTMDTSRPYMMYSTLLIHLMSCPQPLNTSISSPFIDVSHCHSSNSRFSYIKIDRMKASDVPETCRVDAIVMTSWEFENLNVSLQEIHRSLLYGFELNLCQDCGSSMAAWDEFMVFFYAKLTRPFQIFLLILVLSGAAANPVMSIIGFALILAILLFGDGLYIAIRYRDPIDTIYVLTGYRSQAPRNFDFISRMMIIFGPRFIISLFLAWFLIRKLRRRHLSTYDTIERFLQSDNKLVPIRYSYSDIKKMTKNFQDKLGEGGYGSVFKGKVRSGHYVAVKLLGKSAANDQDFMNEIATIGRIHHVNIVTLFGYCAEGSKRALVLDFMANGSFEKYIFNKEKMNSLSWDRKFEIIIGVARGIEYLHRGCDIQILHFDIKPHNIILDDKFIPKVSDFGLAKFFSTEKNTLTLTAARGTIGYVAPELINRGIGRVSYKADVYSYGMLLMEMLGLNRDLERSSDDSSKYFPCWIYDRFNQGIDIEIGRVDENDVSYECESTMILVRKMTIVALWCIQMNPDDRPSMNKVLKMLKGEVEHLQIPHYPFAYTQNEAVTWGSNSTCSVSASLLHHNDASNVGITNEDFWTLP